MKKFFTIGLSAVFAALLVAWPASVAISAEHGGKKEHGGKPAAKEHGGKEHGGKQIKKTPTANDIRGTMQAYVENVSQSTGTFDVLDEATGQVRSLKMVRVHQRVGKTGDYYYSCADFEDVNTGEKLDLDLDVADHGGGKLAVADVRIHKDNGVERYTYDSNDNRIPIAPPVPAVKEHGGKEHGGQPAAKEHGGKEHGGT